MFQDFRKSLAEKDNLINSLSKKLDQMNNNNNSQQTQDLHRRLEELTKDLIKKEQSLDLSTINQRSLETINE